MPRSTLGFLLAAAILTAPAIASAQPSAGLAGGLQLAGDGSKSAEQRRAERREKLDERLDLEDFQREPKRKGFYIGSGLATGMTMEWNSFIPSVGYRFEIGGGLSDRVTLGISGGLTGHLGVLKGSAGVADVVVQGFVYRGLFMKLGLGATSHAPLRNRLKRPGVGGVMGIGWEFRPLRVLGVVVGVDYEGRVRTDGIWTQGILLGLNLRAYLDFKKH